MESNEEKKNRVRISQHATMLALPTCNIEKVTVSDPKGLEGKQALENSIFLTLRLSDSERDNMFLCCFLEWSINIFNVHKWAFEANITNSSSPSMLVKTELKKLNQFFESGEYQAGKAHHSKLVTEDVYDVHTSRLYGGRVELISLERWKDLAEVMNSELIKDPSKQASIDHWRELGDVLGSEQPTDPLEYFKDNIDYVVTLEWYLSIDLQVLLWLRDYLEQLDKSQNYKEIFSNRERVSPLEFLPSESTKQGFNIANPKKTIPALHTALIAGGLIGDIELKDFEDAFLDGNGSIQWLTTSTKANVFGANSLMYFIDLMKIRKVITCDTHVITTVRIFIDRNKNSFKKDTLQQASKGDEPKNADIIKNIVSKLQDLA